MAAQILSALGWGYAGSLWQAALLWLLYQLVTPAISQAYTRQQAGRFALVAVFVLFWINVFSFYQGAAAPQAGAFVHYTAFETVVWPLAGGIYVLLLGIGMAQAAHHWKKLQQLAQTEVLKVPAAYRLFVAQMQGYLGIARKVTVHLYEGAVPFTYGWLRPVIFLPASCITGLSTRQVEALLVHELAHILHHDYLWNLFMQLVNTLLWGNPFVQLLVQATRQEGEKACDAWALQLGYHPAEYGYALLNVARQYTHTAWAPAAGGSSQQLLMQRIEYMLHGGKKSRRPSRNILLWITAAITCLLSLPLLQQAIAPKSQANNSQAAGAKYLTPSAWLPAEKAPVTQSFLLQSIAELRISLFTTQVGTLWQPTPAPTPPPANAPADNTLAATEEAPKKEAVSPDNGNIIDAMWASSQSSQQPGLQGIAAMLTMQALIEKLGQQNDLKDEEWQQLIVLMAHYTSLRTQLYGDAAEPGETGTPANYLLQSRSEQPRLLIVEYDAISGQLKAAVGYLSDLSETMRQRVNEVNAIPVLLLKRTPELPTGETVL